MGVLCTFSFLFYFEYLFLLAITEDPDQTPRSAASDLSLHCLPMSQKWDARLIWVKFESTLSDCLYDIEVESTHSGCLHDIKVENILSDRLHDITVETVLSDRFHDI